MNTRIRNPKRASQLIDFIDLCVDGCIYPTDIDGLIEYRNNEFIILEVKFKGAEVPFGQKLALTRMADAFALAEKSAVVIVCEHDVIDTETAIVASECTVREVYGGGTDNWFSVNYNITVQEFVNMYHNQVKKGM